jgi:ADP-ribosyl-[dinitrogen reductase] hydrolase
MSKTNDESKDAGILRRAQGCLIGQLAGDALGSLVEFRTPEVIRRDYPDGVRELADGGTWDTIAGQPTDDSEMALALARSLVDAGRYDAEGARKAYIFWSESEPFDCGATVSRGLQGRPDPTSQANGALMRVSPIGIFGSNYPPEMVAEWARQDGAITHPHPICIEANALYATAIAGAIREKIEPRELYQQILRQAEKDRAEEALLDTIGRAFDAPPDDYIHQQGWVLIAFGNAWWQLLHASNLEEGVVDTIMRGGDTDTNAAICGALLGAVYGRDAIPGQWIEALLNCRPEAGKAHVHRPRPECFWPGDVLTLAEQLIRRH